jgi:hypothetical protein
MLVLYYFRMIQLSVNKVEGDMGHYVSELRESSGGHTSSCKVLIMGDHYYIETCQSSKVHYYTPLPLMHTNQ